MPSDLASLAQLFSQPTEPMGFFTAIAERARKQKALDKTAFAIRDALDTKADPVSGARPPNPLGDKDSLSALSRADRINKVGGFLKATLVKDALQEVVQQREASAAAERVAAGLGPPEFSAAVPWDNMPIPAPMAARAPPSSAAAILAQANPLTNLLSTLNIRPNTAPTPTGPDTTEAPIRAPGSAGGSPAGSSRLAAIQQLIARNPAAIRNPQILRLADIAERLDAAEQRNRETGVDHPIVEQTLGGGYRGFRMPGSRQMDVRPDLTQPWTELAPGVLQGPGGRTVRTTTTASSDVPEPPDHTPPPGYLWRYAGAKSGWVQSPLPTGGAISAALNLGGAGGSPAGSPAGGSPAQKPTPADIAYLKAHPDVKALFEQRFGKNSAAAYLQ